MTFFSKEIEGFLNPPRSYAQPLIDPSISNRFERSRISFKSFDSTPIVINVFKRKMDGEGGKREIPCVIYQHSHGSSGGEGTGLLETCGDLNLSLALVDCRGSGSSGPGPITFGFAEKFDLLFTIYALISKIEASDFIFFGRSIGCCSVLGLVSLLTPQSAESSAGDSAYGEDGMVRRILGEQFELFRKRNPEFEFRAGLERFAIRGTVLDAPYKSLNSVMESYCRMSFPTFSFLAKYALGFVEDQIYEAIKVNLKNQQNIDYIRRAGTPSTILYSPKDELVTLAEFNELMASRGKRLVSQVIFRDFQHSASHKVMRSSELYRDCLSFLLQPHSHCYVFQLHVPASEPRPADPKDSMSNSIILSQSLPPPVPMPLPLPMPMPQASPANSQRATPLPSKPPSLAALELSGHPPEPRPVGQEITNRAMNVPREAQLEQKMQSAMDEYYSHPSRQRSGENQPPEDCRRFKFAQRMVQEGQKGPGTLQFLGRGGPEASGIDPMRSRRGSLEPGFGSLSGRGSAPHINLNINLNDSYRAGLPAQLAFSGFPPPWKSQTPNSAYFREPPKPLTSSIFFQPMKQGQNSLTMSTLPKPSNHVPPFTPLKQLVNFGSRVFNEPPRNEPPRNEPLRNEPPRNEPPRNEPPRNEPPRNEPPRNQPLRNEPPRNEPPRNEPPRNEPHRNEPPRNEPHRNEPPRNELSRNELSRNELPRNEPPRIQPLRNEVFRQEPHRSEVPSLIRHAFHPPRQSADPQEAKFTMRSRSVQPTLGTESTLRSSQFVDFQFNPLKLYGV